MAMSGALARDVHVRLLRAGDAEALAAAYRRNREHLAPWEPRRSEDFFTVKGQTRVVSARLAQHRTGAEVPWVIEADTEIIGLLSLTGIVRGPFLSASLGYWVDAGYTGRGIASAAVAHATEVAAGELGLHRLQAATLPHNTASQKVLRRSGFEDIGFARNYLQIAGLWQDHRLHQRILY